LNDCFKIKNQKTTPFIYLQTSMLYTETMLILKKIMHVYIYSYCTKKITVQIRSNVSKFFNMESMETTENQKSSLYMKIFDNNLFRFFFF
jgi:hypothetical protein